MMLKIKKIVFLLIMFLCNQSIWSQEINQNETDTIRLAPGIITKYIDYKLPPLRARNIITVTVFPVIREIIQGSIVYYYYRVKLDGIYANIEYTDLLSAYKSITSLEKELRNDLAIDSDYLENEYLMHNGIAIGYFIESKKVMWYISSHKIDKSLIFKDDVNSIKLSFEQAMSMIEELKKTKNSFKLQN